MEHQSLEEFALHMKAKGLEVFRAEVKEKSCRTVEKFNVDKRYRVGSESSKERLRKPGRNVTSTIENPGS